MADILPMFPLGLVAYPDELVNLHIFEPRYKQLVYEADHFGKTFCILPYIDDEQKPIATEMELVEIAKTYPDGKLDIRTRGLGVVKIIDFFFNHPGKLYPGAEIERLPWDRNADVALSRAIIPLIEELYKVMEIDNVPIALNEDFLTFQNAHKIGLSTADEYQLLALSKEQDRQQFILEHLRKFVPAMKDARELRRKAALNGHFKNIKPSF